ncbi:hypothetical protein V3C99_007211 [Haemonchus contortus]|nr:UDP-glucuronosyl UDP-glucosyltransferase domain containing protein [Haemonchus contortus]
MKQFIVFLLTISLCSTDAYKFLVYSPIYGYSHTNFMGALADTLTEAGHNVTILLPIMDEGQQNKTGVKLTTKIIKVPADPRSRAMFGSVDDILSKMWTMEPSIFGLLQMAKNMTTSFVNQCQNLVNDDELMKQLADEKFDVGISETVQICGLGIFEYLKIPASIGVFSAVHMDCLSAGIGEPIMPSYVPGGMATNGDRMNFFERFKNLVSVMVGGRFFSSVFVEEIEVFRAKVGPHFKGYEELLADISYAFTNSNPYIDFPRPMLHKTIPIGGIAVATDSKKNVLSKEWNDILNRRNTTVLVSFGSMAKSVLMPDKYKKTLLEVFESMPETTFIWKYEEESSKVAAHLENVHLSTWLPQNALLADPRLSVFITHGGLGSTTELAHMGKPALLIPLFSDQTRNAHMLTKHGGGIVLKKDDLENPQKLRDSLKDILSNVSYARNAKRLAEMLINQPISAKQLFIKHSEFAAKFGRLPNLDPYGRQLSFFQYFLIDIFLVVIAALAVSIYIVVRILRKIYSVRTKSKKD